MTEREQEIAAARAAHPQIQSGTVVKPRLSFILSGGQAPAPEDNEKALSAEQKQPEPGRENYSRVVPGARTSVRSSLSSQPARSSSNAAESFSSPPRSGGEAAPGRRGKAPYSLKLTHTVPSALETHNRLPGFQEALQAAHDRRPAVVDSAERIRILLDILGQQVLVN